MARDVPPNVHRSENSPEPNHDAQLRPADPPLSALTARQQHVLVLICEGLTAKEMAYKLGLSAKTVEFHNAAIRDRLGIASTAGLVRYAIRLGLIAP